ANTCASGLVSRRKECHVSNGGKMGQFNGLRCVESSQVGVGSSCWSASTSVVIVTLVLTAPALSLTVSIAVRRP
ncbi:hypothetical protein Tco_0885365, partial [Tanacetum coccineum]